MAEDNIMQKIKRWKPMTKRPKWKTWNTLGRWRFGRYKEQHMQLEESSTE